MKRLSRTIASLILVAALSACALFLGCTTGALSDTATQASSGLRSSAPASAIAEDGEYTGKDDVAAYLHQYGHLPRNFVSKTKARRAGWKSEEGNLWDVLPGMSIGGGPYYNDDRQLPEDGKRTWKECDIDYNGGFRNAKRLVYSSDGLIYYTADHYKTFDQLY